jgi:hypothetical protein
MAAGEPVLLHLYDVSTTPAVGKLNDGLSSLGLGALHAGVEVRESRARPMPGHGSL